MLGIYRIIVLFLCIVMIQALKAQNNTISPYSRYGIGDVVNKNFSQSNAMGGVTIGLRTPYHLNIANPASYSAIDTLSFIFEFGLKDKITQLRTSDLDHTFNDINLEYLSVGFPVIKWWASSIGVIPFSNVGYNIKDEASLDNIGQVNYFYEGEGGINQFYIGNSFKILRDLSVGINASYLFGSLNHNGKALFLEQDNAFDFYTYDSTIVGDIFLSYGMQYSLNIKNKYSLTLGAIFDNRQKINAVRTTTSELRYGGNIINTFQDTADREGHIILPVNLGFGLTFSDTEKKFILGIDYSQQDWSKSTFFNENDSLSNSNKTALGFQFTPDNSAPKYWKRIRFRLGGYYSSTYLNLKNQQLNDFGITFGFGLPPLARQKSSFYIKGRKHKTSFNIGFQLGRRGTTDKDLIQENYAIISLNITLYDIWFVKRKFD